MNKQPVYTQAFNSLLWRGSSLQKEWWVFQTIQSLFDNMYAHKEKLTHTIQMISHFTHLFVWAWHSSFIMQAISYKYYISKLHNCYVKVCLCSTVKVVVIYYYICFISPFCFVRTVAKKLVFSLQDVETKMSAGTVSGSKSSHFLWGQLLYYLYYLTVTVSAVIQLSVRQHNTVSQLKDSTPEYVRHGTLQSDNSNGVC